MTDMINPAHYRGDRKFEPIEVIEDWGLNYRLGNAVKYIARNGRKPGEDPTEGLKKAIWYLEREIKALTEPGPYDPSELDYYGQSRDLNEAWPTEQTIPFDGTEDVANDDWSDWEDFWNDNTFDLHVTDGSVFLNRKDGPVGSGGIDVIDFGAAQPVATPWDTDDSYMWDPTLGPTEPLTEEEIKSIKDKKDLKQFEDDEIISTVHRRGLIIGVKKDGSTCLLNPNGTCE